MSGSKVFLGILSFMVLGACVRQARDTMEGEALYLIYKTSMDQEGLVRFWDSPQELLPLMESKDALFLENLDPQTFAFQINQPVYIQSLSYQEGGRILALDFVSRPRNSAVRVDGSLIFIQRNRVERIHLLIDSRTNFSTNLPPRK